MYLADYHMHSRISPDAGTPMALLAEAAIKAGLDEICFTDHVEPIVWGSTRLRPEPYDWAALTGEYRAAREAMGDRITLRLGMELGDAPWSFEHTEKMIADAPELDFVIGSVHMLSEKFNGVDLYFFDPKDDDEAREGMADYLKQVKKLSEWGRFSVLGHLTLPLRYLNENRGFHLTFDGFEREIEEILRTLIGKGLGIELNTNRGNTPLPDAPLLRLYRELGGEIITLGSDAHDTRYVGCAIRERQELLRQCGFRYFTTFEGGRPAFRPL